jgi:hypothetical protein
MLSQPQYVLAFHLVEWRKLAQMIGSGLNQ